jgi:predicted regulator of Ras-like GTPase activity (Roadblock/LC7/MglB family)
VNEEIYNVALRNALIGIKDAMADLNWSFILMNDGTVITSDDSSVDPAIAKAASSFQTLAEKATAIGDLDNMLLNGEKSKVYVSSVNDMYLVAGLTKNADLVYFRTITRAVLPTVLKVLDSVTTSLANAPTPLKSTPAMPISPARTSEPILTRHTMPELTVEEDQTEETEKAPEVEQTEEPEESTELEPELQIPEKEEIPKQPQEIPSQQLIVDRFSGLMVKSDTVQLDAEILKRWSEELDVENVGEVDVETFSGRTVRCKTKVINDPKLEGRGLIRIPEKTCQTLDVRRGELVRVRPVTPQEND